MKKLVFLSIILLCLFSCNNNAMPENIPNPAVPMNAIGIESGEYVDSLSLYAHSDNVLSEHFLFKYDHDEDLLVRINFLYKKDTPDAAQKQEDFKNGYWHVVHGTYKRYNPLGWYGYNSEWYESHIERFSSIDTEKYLLLLSEYSHNYPFRRGLLFHYMRIKSLKLYSLNCEVAGREIGSDLSDLFECRYHPLFFIYPDCSSFVEDYLSDTTPFPLSKYVELGVCPEDNIFIYPTFKLKDRDQYRKIDYRLEIVIEDEVRGETYLSADLVRQ